VSDNVIAIRPALPTREPRKREVAPTIDDIKQAINSRNFWHRSRLALMRWPCLDRYHCSRPGP